MNEGQKNIAVWVSLPLIGLLLLVAIFAAYVVAPIALILALIVVFVFLSGRKRG
jgi:ABC-type microcin C transport system permease subunit YejE